MQLSKSAKEASEIDQNTGTDYWERYMNKEMKTDRVSYETVDNCTPYEVKTQRSSRIKRTH